MLFINKNLITKFLFFIFSLIIKYWRILKYFKSIHLQFKKAKTIYNESINGELGYFLTSKNFHMYKSHYHAVHIHSNFYPKGGNIYDFALGCLTQI